MQMLLFDNSVEYFFQTTSGVDDISGSVVKDHFGTHSDQAVKSGDVVKVAKGLRILSI